MSGSVDRLKKLYFVWDSDWSIGGAVQAAKDFVLDIESCALCQIASRGIAEKQTWKDCKDALPVTCDHALSEPARR